MQVLSSQPCEFLIPDKGEPESDMDCEQCFHGASYGFDSLEQLLNFSILGFAAAAS